MAMKDKIIEKLENILYEYGWIMRPHGEETDNLLNDFESELELLEQQEKCYPEKQIEEWKCEKCKKKKAIYHVCGECLIKIFEFKRK